MKRFTSALLTAALAATAAGQMPAQSHQTPPIAPSNEWPTYGHDSGGLRYSPLTQISPANVDAIVDRLDVSHAAAPAPGGEPFGASGSEITPLVANGVMYISTPYSRVVALDPTTGKEIVGLSTAVGQPVHPRRRILAR